MERKSISNTEQLLDCRSQIIGALDDLERNVQDRILARQDEHAKSTQQAIEGLRMESESIKDHVIGFLQTENGQRRLDAILTGLRYQNMKQRRMVVPTAAQSTFQWVLSPDSPLSHWLRAEASHRFWVSGKAGSGKSTLMKFLFEQPETLRNLERWAGSHELLVGDHFFWIAGNTEINFDQALYQSMLSDIIAAKPTVAAIICRDRWEASEADAARVWDKQELLQALCRLGEVPDTKLAFFIDGLDEYQGDHTEMCKDIMKISEQHNVKVCFSSRPWTIFDRSFQSDPGFSLQDLTRDDIRAYFWSRVAEAEKQADCYDDFRRKSSRADQFIKNCTQRAEGVFFWALLVANALCERAAAGEDVDRMELALYQFPRGLGDFFKKMVFDRIHETWRQGSEIACALLLALRLSTQQDFERAGPSSDTSFLNYWLVMRSADMKSAIDVLHRPIKNYSVSQLDQMARATRLRLQKCCLDLVHVIKIDDTDNPILAHRVDFLHRTVYDFLHSAEMQAELISRTPPDFQDPRFLARLALARLRVVPVGIENLQQYYHSMMASWLLWDAQDRIPDASMKAEYLSISTHYNGLFVSQGPSESINNDAFHLDN
jgi:hypothetical protein